MGKRSKSVAIFCLLLLIVGISSIQAQWQKDEVAICVVMGSQISTQITSDGSGGAIITWQDSRDGNWDIYAQMIDASGTVQWTANAVAVCETIADQEEPQIISDGAGGAIITWQDYRSGTDYDIYAQWIDASGTVQWPRNGVAICTATNWQQYPQITVDGSGGAIITWQDLRSGTDTDIYAQRIDASGTVQWAANGVAICAATNMQEYPEIISDDIGGAIITWQDSRNGNWDIYGQRVNSNGTVRWTANGIPVCVQTGDQVAPQITSDEYGGAIITWADTRSGTSDIYTQRISPGGTDQWTANGVATCTQTGGQIAPQITSDGSRGGIVTWQDFRSGSNNDVYAQRIDAGGTVQWTAGGVAISTQAADQEEPQIISDGAGGAIITWSDERPGPLVFDVYAQRINASGTVQWTTDGVAVCAATEHQMNPRITSDGASGAIIAWEDSRNMDIDIYAHLIERTGNLGFYPAPEIYSVRDVPGDQGGLVYLSWYASRMDILMYDPISHYTLWRAINPAMASSMLKNGAILLTGSLDIAPDVSSPVIRMERLGSDTYFWELVGTQDAYYLEAYGKSVATLFDSTGVCNEYHHFQVIAHTFYPKVFWVSEPDSGYSVDNLPPGQPQGLAGEQIYIPEGLNITWDPNTEPDLSHYAVYRGLDEVFVPGPGNLIASTPDTVTFDDEWRWNSGYYYKVAALDIHGNESPFALLTPSDVTEAGPTEAPLASYLSQNFPNPFNPRTTIVFGLNEAGDVKLVIYDTAGKLVRTLVNGMETPGEKRVTWDGRDDHGSRVATGVYFYRMTAPGFEKTKKMILLK